MDESIDEFKQNFQLIKEKKLKIAQISKFLSPSQPPASQATISEKQQEVLLKTKPSLSKLNESVKESFIIKSKSKLKSSKSALSNYFRSPSETVLSAVEATTSKKSSEKEEKSNEAFKCPLCSSDLAKFGESERQQHVNKCLDRDFSNKSSKNKFKHNETPRQDEPSTAVNSKVAEASTVDNHLETSQKSESSENAEQRQKRLNENLLRDAVPNCPICGKVLHTMIVFILLLFFRSANVVKIDKISHFRQFIHTGSLNENLILIFR